MQDIVEMLRDAKYAGNALAQRAAEKITRQRAFITTTTTRQTNTVRMYELLVKFVDICNRHNLDEKYYSDSMMGFHLTGVMDGSEEAIEEAATLGNDKLENEEQEQDENEPNVDDEKDEQTSDYMNDDVVIGQLEKGLDASAQPLMLAAAAEIKQLGLKTDACYPTRANAVDMFDNLELLYCFSRNYDIEYISDSFGTNEVREVLREAKRVGNDKIWC